MIASTTSFYASYLLNASFPDNTDHIAFSGSPFRTYLKLSLKITLSN